MALTVVMVCSAFLFSTILQGAFLVSSTSTQSVSSSERLSASQSASFTLSQSVIGINTFSGRSSTVTPDITSPKSPSTSQLASSTSTLSVVSINTFSGRSSTVTQDITPPKSPSTSQLASSTSTQSVVSINTFSGRSSTVTPDVTPPKSPSTSQLASSTSTQSVVSINTFSGRSSTATPDITPPKSPSTSQLASSTSTQSVVSINTFSGRSSTATPDITSPKSPSTSQLASSTLTQSIMCTNTVSFSESLSASQSASSTLTQSIMCANTVSFSESLSASQSASESAQISSFIRPSRSSFISQSMSASSVLNRDNMYPHGPEHGDEALISSGYWYLYLCQKIKAPSLGFPFYGKRHYKLYICPDGKIQLNLEWRWWWPQTFGAYRWFDNMAIMAPFWATIDDYWAFRDEYSHVYYQVYQRTVQNTIQKAADEVLTLASEHVQLYDRSGGFTQFQATWVLVVTWENLCPYRYYRWDYEVSGQNCPRSNTFQAVIITDQINTFLMYNYPEDGIQWVVPFDQCVSKDDESCSYWANWYGIPVAGWNAGDNQRHNYLNMEGSGTLLGMLALDEKKGNSTDVMGRHFWRIENVDPESQKCRTWANEQQLMDIIAYTDLSDHDRNFACPCTLFQAWFDVRFFWNWWENPWPDYCFKSRRSTWVLRYVPRKGYVYILLKQLCCYSIDWDVSFGSLKVGEPDGGHVSAEFYRSSWWYFPWSGTVVTDQEAYKSCCVDTPHLCSVFYRYRPSHDCSDYFFLPRRWFCCDPHFKTLDGGNYTFNGLGEYVMVDGQDGKFQLQARTGLAQGNSTTATIFIAGAAKEENTSTVEVRVKPRGGLSILLEGEIYNGYNNLTNRSVSVGGNISFSKPEENCLEVSFPSASNVKFCEKKQSMLFVVSLAIDYKNATKGLLGTWNDNPDDDFTLPDGSVLQPSSTARAIHFEFGVKWQINESQSLFIYGQNESINTFARPDFVPMFADNITWQNDSLRLAAEAQCGEDHDCLFDVASTNDLSVGVLTKDINVQLVNETNSLENFPPKIVDVPTAINVTFNRTIKLVVKAEDNDTIAFRVINKPENATENQIGNVLHFTWHVTSTKKFNLSFVATDGMGASSTWNPTINMCACLHDGLCVMPEEGDDLNTGNKFVYMGCACQGGYTGRFCDSEIDACELNGQPCYQGVDCIDLPPPANISGYTCGPCPSGLTGNGAQCTDINECDQAGACGQVCINTPGSFVCDCRNGYTLNSDGKTCDDVNECEGRNECKQRCDNEQGTYNCSCDQYFKQDPSDWRNCLALNPCSSDNGCEHVCFKGDDNEAKCACFAKYELNDDGVTCRDIDECAKDIDGCDQICTNTPGSYICSCQKGFKLRRDSLNCQDINECIDEDLFNCTDEFHKCVNTRGSYKCECGNNLYFIDGKCRGLAKNETAPVPTLTPPRVPSITEQEQAVAMSLTADDDFKWDFNTDKSFKDTMASVTSDYCESRRTECALKDQRRKRREATFDLYEPDQVHLLPGYPSNVSGSLQVAFYVQQPAGLFIGNTSVLPSNTLLQIVESFKSDLENAIGENITSVKATFAATTQLPTTQVQEFDDESSNSTTTQLSTKQVQEFDDESSNSTNLIAIGVSVAVFTLLFVVFIVIFVWRINRNRARNEIRPVHPDSLQDAQSKSVQLNTHL
ncbi:mucin-like protein isoform X1 [Montipora foliosa]|uniref:mucin-like protein isoform X1 n=1 Tax=Montipora foliosa TaxID=591990 RepID=UPI0035F1CF4A